MRSSSAISTIGLWVLSDQVAPVAKNFRKDEGEYFGVDVVSLTVKRRQTTICPPDERALVALHCRTFEPDCTFAGSQPGHTFPEPGGHDRSPQDTKAAGFEFRRAIADPGGHARTRHQDGSGP